MASKLGSTFSLALAELEYINAIHSYEELFSFNLLVTFAHNGGYDDTATHPTGATS